jgi:cell division septal protein FtsQ
MIGVLLLYGLYTLAFLRPYFQVGEIEIKGSLAALTEDDIILASGINIGDHLLRIPVGGIQERLMQNPWIKEAAVHRKFPHMVWIYIKEYVPVALVRMEDWYYVDRLGHPFKKLEAQDDKDFPLITGLEGAHEGPLTKDDEFKIVESLRVKNLFENSELGEVYGLSEIHFTNNSGVSLITLNDPVELKLGFGPFMEKIERLEITYQAIKSHGGMITTIDLNPEGKVVVKYGT